MVIGNVTINYTASNDLNLPSGLTTYGDLTVNAPDATVNNRSIVTGTITINKVSKNTWNELTTGNSLVFKTKGGKLNIGKNVTVGCLTLDAENATLNVSDHAYLIYPVAINKTVTIITSKPITAIVDKGVKVIVKANKNEDGKEVIGTGDEIKFYPPVDKTDLISAINNAVDIKKDDYTIETWDFFEDALNAAKEVNKKENVTKDEIDKAIRFLNIAKEGLVQKI